MTDLLDFLPLFAEDESSVRARMDADANAGLAPDDADFVDVRQGGFYQITTQPAVMEFARIYDEMSTRLAAGFLPFAWGDYLDYHGEMLGLPRLAAVAATGTVTFTGPVGDTLPANTQISPTQIDPDVPVPVFQTTAAGVIGAGGTVDVPIQAIDPGVAGKVPAGAINVVLSPLAVPITSVTNAVATVGGTDVESDAAYRNRMLIQFSGVGPGNINDYKRWALNTAGVGAVTVQAVWNGPSTVRLVITAPDGGPAASTVVTDLQDYLDPVPGQSKGEAPVGAIVSVTTPAIVNVNVTASIVFETGYSLDGAGGTTALASAITAAIQAYLDSLDVGDDVIFHHLLASFFTVQGVHDVTLTAPAADVPIDGSITPPQVAKAGVITLS